MPNRLAKFIANRHAVSLILPVGADRTNDAENNVFCFQWPKADIVQRRSCCLPLGPGWIQMMAQAGLNSMSYFDDPDSTELIFRNLLRGLHCLWGRTTVSSVFDNERPGIIFPKIWRQHYFNRNRTRSRSSELQMRSRKISVALDIDLYWVLIITNSTIPSLIRRKFRPISMNRVCKCLASEQRLICGWREDASFTLHALHSARERFWNWSLLPGTTKTWYE